MAASHNALTDAHTQLTKQHNAQTNRLQNLRTDHEALNSLYTLIQVELEGVQTELAKLKTRYDGLMTQYNELNGRYTTLQQEHTNLVASHNELNQTYSTLYTNYNSLQGNYNSLSQEYAILKSIALEPPYISVTGERTVDLVFYRRNGTIDAWAVPFNALEYDVLRGSSMRSNKIEELIVFIGSLSRRMKASSDFTIFVDPDPFHTVVSDLYYEINNEQAFIEELWNITTQLTEYNYEIGEVPRYPLETFLSGGGDCEDTAILLASMLKAAPANWEVSLVYMDANSPYQTIRYNHVMVHLRTGRRDYLIETTSDTVMEPYGPNMVDGNYVLIEG